MIVRWENGRMLWRRLIPRCIFDNRVDSSIISLELLAFPMRFLRCGDFVGVLLASFLRRG
jgi:hypothetical protein